MTTSHQINLGTIADQEMVARGFKIDFGPDAIQEAAGLSTPEIANAAFRDMRQLLWFSIDNDDSKDLDQLTYAERTDDGQIMVYVAVADVSGLVKINDPIDKHAYFNTTSVYTPAKIFPMLPLRLSTDLTSLNQGADRCAVVTQSSIAPDGRYTLVDIYLAQVCNKAKLTYNGVSSWLEGKGALPPGLPDLGQQLKLQEEAAQKIQKYRTLQGALNFATVEIQAIIINHEIKLEQAVYNRAQAIISNMMIVANTGMTHFLTEKKIPTLRRIVKTPNRWDRIVSLAKAHGDSLPDEPDVKALQRFLIHQKTINPNQFADLSLAVIKLIGRGEYQMGFPGERVEGHFDLALTDYAHTTAPNRRFPDLVMQRLLKGYLVRSGTPYTNEELTAIASHCTAKEDDATKVERRVNKSASALAITHQIGQQFSAIVTGASDKGTWVKIKQPPVEGKLIKGFEGVDVGDKITVKLVETDVAHGFIDFIKV